MMDVILIGLSPSTLATLSGDLFSIVSIYVRHAVGTLHSLTMVGRIVYSASIICPEDLAHHDTRSGIKSYETALLNEIASTASCIFLILKFDSLPISTYFLSWLILSLNTDVHLPCSVYFIFLASGMVRPVSAGSISLLTIG